VGAREVIVRGGGQKRRQRWGPERSEGGGQKRSQGGGAGVYLLSKWIHACSRAALARVAWRRARFRYCDILESGGGGKRGETRGRAAKGNGGRPPGVADAGRGGEGRQAIRGGDEDAPPMKGYVCLAAMGRGGRLLTESRAARREGGGGSQGGREEGREVSA